MTIKLALLKSGEEVISDIKEFRDPDDNLVSYLFKSPHYVKLSSSQVLVEGVEQTKYNASFYKWMALSKDNDIVVNYDWVVCIVEPIDEIKKSYEEKLNGTGTGNVGNGIGDSDASNSLTESVNFDQQDSGSIG
jgi:hypothetical protein